MSRVDPGDMKRFATALNADPGRRCNRDVGLDQIDYSNLHGKPALRSPKSEGGSKERFISKERIMRLSHAIGATVVGVMFSTAVFAQTAGMRPAAAPATAPKASNAAPLIDTARPIMQIEEVALKGTTNVFGDPSKAGSY